MDVNLDEHVIPCEVELGFNVEVVLNVEGVDLDVLGRNVELVLCAVETAFAVEKHLESVAAKSSRQSLTHTKGR